MTRKFKIGEIVFLRPSLSQNAPAGAYVVIKRLPEYHGEFEYRVRNSYELHERVVVPYCQGNNSDRSGFRRLYSKRRLTCSKLFGAKHNVSERCATVQQFHVNDVDSFGSDSNSICAVSCETFGISKNQPHNQQIDEEFRFRLSRGLRSCAEKSTSLITAGSQ
jgi:hypothetical protein